MRLTHSARLGQTVFRATLFSVGLTAFMSRLAAAQALTSDELRMACKRITDLPNILANLDSTQTADRITIGAIRVELRADTTAGVIGFCEARAPVDRVWANLLVPRAEDIRAAGKSATKTGMFDLTNVKLIDNIGHAFGAAETPGVIGLEQFVVNRASKELNAAVVQQYATRLCTRVVHLNSSRIVRDKETLSLPAYDLPIERFVGETCLTLRGGDEFARATPTTLPAWSVVRASLKRDLGTLPETLFARVVDYTRTTVKAGIAVPSSQALALSVGDQLVSAQAVARFARTFEKKHSPAESFAAAMRELNDAVDSLDKSRKLATWSALPVARSLASAALYGSSLSAELIRASFDGTGGVTGDTVALYAEKTLAVNALGSANDCKDADAGELAVLRSRFALTSTECGAKRTVPFDASGLWSIGEPLANEVADVAQKLANAPPKDAVGTTTIVANGLVDILPTIMYAAVPTSVGSGVSQRDFEHALALTRRLAGVAASRMSERYADLAIDATTFAAAIGGAELQRVVMPEQLARTIQFATDVVDAEDADAVEAAIEKAAAPLDAYSRKRLREPGESNRYVTVNAFAGGSAGAEWASGPALNGRVLAKSAGLYVPIGVELGIKELIDLGSKTPGISAGLFLQLLDLGQVAQWRLTASDSVVKADPPAFKLQNVFSPGAFAVFHIPTFPISVGFGGAWAPRFREISQLRAQPSGQAPLPTRADAFRLAAFLAVDVPILP